MKWRSYPIRRVSKVRWLGNLPEHWQIRSLKRLARVELSNVDKLTVEGERLVRLCNYVDVYKNERIGATLPFMQASASKEQIRRLSLRRGDVIITKDSETPDDIGVPALVAEDMEDVVCGYHLALVRPKQAQADGGFLQRVMQSAYVRAEFCCSAVGMTRYGLGKYDIENVALPAPPLDEQETIARFLDRETAKLDTLIAKQERLIELLQDKRQAVISHAVTKGLDPKAPMKESGVEWLGEIPAHWRAKRLKFISPFITVGIVVNPSTYVADEGLPFIYGGDIAEGRIDAFGARRISDSDSRRNQKTRLAAGDLVTVRVGAPGITAVVPKECDGGNCASVMLVRKGSYDSDWLCYAMNSPMVRDQVSVVQYGAAQEQFNISHAINFWVATPPRSEQLEIAAYLGEAVGKLDGLMKFARRSIDLMREHRSALISAAVTGKIDVRSHADMERDVAPPIAA